MKKEELIRKAQFYFHTVFDDGDRFRIYRTGWSYEPENIFRSVSDLEEYIEAHERDLLEEFDFIAPEDLRELGLLF